MIRHGRYVLGEMIYNRTSTTYRYSWSY